MKVWLVTLYEPLPLFGKKIRTMRGGFLCKALDKNAVDTTLWLPVFDHIKHKNFQKADIHAVDSENIKIKTIKGLSYSYDQSPFRYLHNIFLEKEFNRLLAQEETKPDLIITHIPSLELSYAAAKYSKLNNIPLAVDVRDLWPDIYKSLIPFRNNFIYKLIFRSHIKKLKFILKQSKAITAISDSYLQWAIDKRDGINRETDKVFYIGYPKQITSRYNSPNKNDYREIYKKNNLSLNDKTIIFSGTFCDSYNFETIFKLSKNEEFKQLGLKLIIAGTGEGADEIQRFSNGNKNFIYTGWLSKRDLDHYLNNAFLAIAPYSETALMSLPNKPFEYLAHGLPIINSLKGEISDIIEKYNLGRNFSISSEKELLESISQLAQNPNEYNQVRENCLNIHRRQFDSEKIYNDYFEFIKALVSK